MDTKVLCVCSGVHLNTLRALIVQFRPLEYKAAGDVHDFKKSKHLSLEEKTVLFFSYT